MECKHCGLEINPEQNPTFGLIYRDASGNGGCPPDPKMGVFSSLTPFHEPKDEAK